MASESCMRRTIRPASRQGLGLAHCITYICSFCAIMMAIIHAIYVILSRYAPKDSSLSVSFHVQKRTSRFRVSNDHLLWILPAMVHTPFYNATKFTNCLTLLGSAVTAFALWDRPGPTGTCTERCTFRPANLALSVESAQNGPQNLPQLD